MPRESLENKKIRAKKIIALLKKNYPNAKCSLNFSSVHELMVATILSAQCTDERVNKTTPALFEKYKSIDKSKEKLQYSSTDKTLAFKINDDNYDEILKDLEKGIDNYIESTKLDISEIISD